jgi:hypothetical protein
MKIKLMGLLMPIFIFVACEDEFLEKTNYNGMNSDNFMQYESQAIEAIAATYDPLTYQGLYNFSFLVLGEIPTDNMLNDWGDGRYGPDMVSLHNFNWTASNQYFVLRWNSCYKGIGRANYVLENLDKVEEISEASYNQIKGEAHFLRGLYYFNLVSGFGDVPLVTSLLSPDESNNISNSPASEIWAQIDNDLVQASSLLSASYSSSADLGRATKGAAYGLLSRVRLWTKDYPGAESAANSAESLGYGLVSKDNFIQMFDGRMENSFESLFEVQLIPGFGAYFNKEKAETSLLMHMFPRVSWGRYFNPRKTLNYDVVDFFEAGDMRRQSSILIAGTDSIFYVGANKMSVFPDLGIHTDFRVDLRTPGAYQTRKFLPYDTDNWRRGGKFFNYGASINIPVVRLAEVILNKAEALVEQGKLGEAFNELERIRTRAGLDMTGISQGDQSALREQIKKDRRVELIFEGHRWGDLKRWGELSNLSLAGLNYSGQVDWPIPSQEIDINPNLGN